MIFESNSGSRANGSPRPHARPLEAAHRARRSGFFENALLTFLDAQQGVERPVGAEPVGMGEAAGSSNYRDHESDKRLRRGDGVGAFVGECHQLADLSGQPDPLEESDETVEAAERGDALAGRGESDLPSGKDRITGTLQRLKKGCGVRLFDTTLLPQGLTPNDAFGFRV